MYSITNRSVTRLQQEVQTLRSSDGTTDTTNAMALRGSDSLAVAEAKKRQMDAEVEADRYFQSYKAEEKRRMELEELLKTQQPLKAITDGQLDRAQLTRDKLTQEASKQAAKLEKQRENKKRRMHAFMLIQMFLKRKVIPKFRTRKAEAAKDQLCNLLLGAVTRKKYGKTKAAVLKIQALIRGKLHRMRAKKFQEVGAPPPLLFMYYALSPLVDPLHHYPCI